MVLLFLSIVWVLTVAGLLARAVTQYRHYQVIRPSARSVEGAAPAVKVIVPARDEAANIGRCVGAILAQDYPRDALQVIVVDDDSRDRTAAIVRALAQQDDRLQLIQSGSLPPGWAGKPYACWQGAQYADGQWLCFIDADTTAHPPLIRTAVQTALARQADLLSLQPFQELKTPWERLILPAGFFLLAFTQDVRRTGDPASPGAAVNGQFLLIRGAAYQSVGGHAAVKSALAEDSALAAVLKSAGYRIAVLGTQGLLHTRMYTSLRPLWEGTARQAAQLVGGTALPGVFAAALVLAWAPLAMPAWAAASLIGGGGALSAAALLLTAAGSLALFGTHLGAARYFRIPFWYGLLFPIGYTLGGIVVLYALLQQLRGQVRWKGRVYDAVDPVPHGPAQAPQHVAEGSGR